MTGRITKLISGLYTVYCEETKRQAISALNDEHSRWGVYVFLTNDTGDKKISWKDFYDCIIKCKS